VTEIVDKRGVLRRIAGAKLDLGCGPRKRGPDYIGVDARDHEAVDVVGDVFDVLASIPDASIAYVFSSHFMEHVDRIPPLIQELGRVLAPGGKLETIVPHFSNPYYYSDVTHRTAFGIYSMAYFAVGSHFRRQVPMYAQPALFQLNSVKLVFKAPRPFYGRYAINKVVERIVNSSRAAKEFYEGVASYWIPCYELRFLMTRIADSEDRADSASENLSL